MQSLSLGLGRAAVDDEQQNQQRHEHQRGQSVQAGLDALAGGRVDQRGQILHQGRCGEVADGEIVNGEGEGQHGPGDDAALALGYDHMGQGVGGRRAQVQGRLVGVLVHLLELRQNR